ncbi:hypothetical protein RY831_00400 [Noviherbaspirillum sp. CPCC 100848]|uniref:Uncharacterized protein n=1 Tax=Noviherbaspirillum album TaxID=3080276 RepID=A0ABU6J1V3_9BURK|nr:hypothetical protein [Noviherbaspirillum sp. CPCC 100848]MEC4717601.1 hypothetical protein [Noviherbaspirillum sp. CPCC 100848]
MKKKSNGIFDYPEDLSSLPAIGIGAAIRLDLEVSRIEAKRGQGVTVSEIACTLEMSNAAI